MVKTQKPVKTKKATRPAEKPTPEPIANEPVQDFIPVKTIENGMIITKDHRYIKIVEVKPLNFLMRSAAEQNVIVATIAGWLKIAPVKVQIKSITRRADINKHIASVQKDLDKEYDLTCVSLGRAYLELVQSIKERQSLSRRFLIIFSYDGLQDNSRTTDVNEIATLLEMAANNVRARFEQCGNESIKFDSVEEENEFLEEILYSFFNRRSSNYESLAYRKEQVYNHYRKIAEAEKRPFRSYEVPISDVVAPRGLDMSQRKFLIMDGLYYAFLYVTSDGYRETVGAAWTTGLVGLGEGVDVDIYLTKQPRSKTIDDVNRRLRLNKIKLKNSNDTSGDFEDVAASVNAAYFIKNEISNGDDLYYMTTYITVTARTIRSLGYKIKQINDHLKASDIDVRECVWQNEEALKSVMPLCEQSTSFYRKGKRNLTTTAAAALYPFTAFEFCDDNGILLGVNKANQSLTILDLFNTKLHSNANMTVLGSSGKGKTFLMSLMAMRMRVRGIQTFIIAPIKGEEFVRVCSALDGTYVKISPASRDCINVMEIRNTDRSVEMLISGDDIGKDPLLMKKIDQLNVFFSMLIPDMNYEEQQMMDEALVVTYARKGITADNDSLYTDADKKQMKEMPTLGDLYNTLKESEKTDRLATIVRRFVSGSAQAFNGQTNVDLTNKLVVLDLSDLSKMMKPIGMFIALDYVWDRARANRIERKSIIIDEVWQLIGASSSPLAASFVMDVYKLIRSSGGSAISATQDLSDFFALEDGKFGRAIINNSATKIVLGLGPEEADRIAETMKLTPAEHRSIIAAQTGEALIVSAGSRVMVNVIASEAEKEMITTNRQDLEAIAEKARKAKSNQENAQ